MNKEPLIIKSEDYRTGLKVIDTKVTVLARVNDTNGQEFTYQSGPEGAGPAPHSHDWDESFFVIKGAVEVTANGKTEICEPGTLAYVPGGIVHSFSFGPDGGEMLEITGNGSKAVQMFTDLSKEVSSDTPNVEKIVEVMGRNGATVHL